MIDLKRGDVFRATNKLGESYTYLVICFGKTYNGIDLYNVTIDDGTFTGVEEEWFNQREICMSFDNYYFDICEEFKEQRNISSWSYNSLNKALFELNKKGFYNTETYRIIKKEFDAREKLCPSFYNTMWHDLSSFIPEGKFKRVDIYKLPKKKPDDVFVSIKLLDNRSVYGYVKLNKAMSVHFNKLIECSSERMSVQIIQWSDRFLAVFQDSSQIASAYAFIEKEEVMDFFIKHWYQINV